MDRLAYSICQEIDKKNYTVIIEILKTTNCYLYKINENQKIEKYINIAITIINKYDDKDSWYFKKFLELFYCIYFTYIQTTDINPIIFEKIRHILPKYKLSLIIKLFLKKINLTPVKTSNDLKKWIENDINCELLHYHIQGMIFIIPYLIQDIKTPNKFELCTTNIEQLIFVIYNYNDVLYL